MSTKKVTHFIRKSSQLRASFIQNQILNHQQYTPKVVFKIRSEKEYDGGFAEFNENDISLLALDETSNSFSKIKFKFARLISRSDKKKISNFVNDSDILHFHYGTDAGIYLPILKDLNIPKVVSFYGYDCSGFPKRLGGLGKTYLQKRVFCHADRIFAMSEDMKNDLRQCGCPEEKIIVHYYGTDTKRFHTKHDYEDQDQIKFLIISGFVPQKGHIFMLKAFLKALEKNRNINLTIVGEGPLRQEINAFVKEKKMDSVVKLKGGTVYGTDEHKAYLKNADVFIHPSVTDVNGDKEGIPGAVIEAMAAGLPIISTYHAGIPNVIQHRKFGLLVDEWNIDELSSSILEMAEKSELRKLLGIEGQKNATNSLDLHVKETELEQIYGDLS